MQRILFVLALLLLAGPAWAADFTAASCSRADVQAAIDLAVSAGDRVLIPAGDCTWTTNVTTYDTHHITLQGAGTAPAMGPATSGGTTINFAPVSQAVTLTIRPATTGSGVVTNIRFRVDVTNTENPSSGYIFLGNPAANVKPIIFHHNRFDMYNFPAANCGGRWMINSAMVSGVIYRNIFFQDPPTAACSYINAVTIVHPAMNVPNGEASWNGTSTWGALDTTGEASLYIETNEVHNGVVNAVDTNDGSRTVVRFNTLYDSRPINHGHDTGNIGTRLTEVYKNTWIRVDQGSGQYLDMPTLWGWRGGTGIVMDNVSPVIPSIGFGSLNTFVLHNPAAGCPAVAYPWFRQIGWGYDGTHTLDANGADQQIEPTYIWNNYTLANQQGSLRHVLLTADTTGCGAVPAVRPSQQTFLKHNREVYQHNTGFDGAATVENLSFTMPGTPSTGGVGVGTRASRPATCTPRVGWWSTDQGGNWDTTGGGANDGALDICTATNTWTNGAWIPKTYPHPLATETGSPASPSMGRTRIRY